MSSLGWIDFSSEHREKVKTVLDLLKKPGVIDELGIGVIRDAFADRMFPGISTIQTRAKYFTLVAYRVQTFIERSGNRETLENYLGRHEKMDRIKLVENHGENGELGIVGGTFGSDWSRDVIRKPSSIYWNGLRTFGFITPEISLSEFSARLSKGKKSIKEVLKGSKDDDGDASKSWENQQPRVTIPSPDPDYWETLEIHLTPEEARVLRQHIIDREPDSLVGQILLHPKWLEEVLEFRDGSDGSFEEFCELPFLQKVEVPGLTSAVEHARDFWRIMNGAHIRYNCLLQEGADDSSKGEEFHEKWLDWLEEMTPFPARWDNDFLWELVGTQTRSMDATKKFVTSWIEQTQLGCPDLRACNELVRVQELQNKRARARLNSANRGGHPSDWVGLSGLNYRLSVALQLLRDIHDAQMKGSARA